MVDAKRLADIIRTEAIHIMDTELSMIAERRGWKPSGIDKARLAAVAAAAHQLKFSLLSIADELEKISG